MCNLTENLLGDFFEEIGTAIGRQEYFSFPKRQNMNQNWAIFMTSIVRVIWVVGDGIVVLV
jgi:hypothetical protein